MSSPSQPFEELLRSMSVPDHAGVYVLGSFARRVTLYSQQVRALNLVEALCKIGRLTPDSRLAVIGGGAAGMTAAAGAAVRGVSVHLLEKYASPLRLQRASQKRYLHPHIYDWPDEAWKQNSAGLPLLNWQAGYANEVAKEIEAQWKELKAQPGSKLRPEHWESKISKISRTDSGKVNLNWNDSKGPQNFTFEAVIIAVGFGLESAGDWQPSYWEDDGLDFIENRSWLVSGYGDGGLTDLMRLCIKDFRHDEIVRLFANAPGLEELSQRLLDIERESQEVARQSPEQAREFITEKYQEIESPSVIQLLSERKREDTEVTFNGGSPFMYGPESSILNRFVVSQLRRIPAFTHKPGKLDPPERDGDKFRVKFDDGSTEEFDRVLFRHGPTPALKNDFPQIWDSSEELRKWWRELPPSSDDSRRPMWGPDAFQPGEANPFGLAAATASAAGAVADYDVGNEEEVGCVVVLPEGESHGAQLLTFVTHSLERWKEGVEKILGRTLRVKPVTIKLTDALSNPAEYARAVRALCKADIAIFDLTEYTQPGMMLLLGIRSVARRSVTITTTSNKLDSKEWAKLPFNLKELNPISYNAGGITFNDPKHPITVIGKMIERGLSLSRSLPQSYLDLPAFDAVRRLGPNPEHYVSIPPEQQILVLCSFNDEYVRDHWDGFLALELQTAYKGHAPELVRIIDIGSPLLVGQRLYAEIRRNLFCLVDWTQWRPNVFFELGVRLAVNGTGPVSVISRGKPNDPPGAHGAQKEALMRLFSPIPYSVGDDAGTFAGELLKRYKEVTSSPEVGANSWGALAHNQTFGLIYESISLSQEPGGSPVHQELREAVKAMIGDDPRRQGTKPVLFYQNADLMRQVRAGAIERLFAAWYYLQQRHRAGSLPDGHPLRQDYVSIGNMLSSILLDSNDAQEREMGEQIDDELFALSEQQPDGEAEKI